MANYSQSNQLLRQRAVQGLAAGLTLLAAHSSVWAAAPDDAAIRNRYSEVKAGTGPYAPARQAKEDWDRARTLANTDPDWKNFVTQRRYAVSGWMNTQHEDPEQAVGWLQNYVNPATGAWLSWTPSTPKPADNGSNSKQVAAWVAFMRFYNVDRMLDAARLYKLQGDVRYRDWAASQLDFYAANYNKFALQTWNGEARMFSQSLDESNNMFSLLDVIRLLRGSVDDSRIANWRDNLIGPMVANQIKSRREANNISVWKAAAITAAGLEFGNQAWISSGRDGALGLRGLLDQGMSADDFWFEGSLSYQEYVVQALVNVLTSASLNNQLDPVKDVLWRAQNLMISPAALAFKPGVAPAINDTPPNRPSPSRPLWTQSRRVLPTWIGLADAGNARDWTTLLDPPETASGAQATVPVVSQHFAGLDAVQVVSHNWHALVVYGQKAKFHAHQEALNLQLQYGDTWILQSPGTVGYGSPLHAGYFRLAPAHNVPLIDGDGQLPYPSEGKFDGLTSNGEQTTVEHPAYRSAAQVKRELNASGTDFIDTVTITRQGTTASGKLGLIFNTTCTISPEGTSGAAGSGSLPGGAFRFWKNTAIYAAPAQWSATLHCGTHSFRLSVSSPALQRVFVGVVPNSVAPYSRQGLYLEGEGASAQFVTRFTPLS